jgi:YegS/Rv2252/BmrU family lipid kinase
MKKLFFVMNPMAGQRRANRFLVDIVAIFNRAGYDVSMYMTAGSGDAARIVAEKAPEMDLVVCAGGDGTFNETVTGVLQSGADTPIGYIPCGSTNDFATSLRLSLNVLQAARDIAEGTPMRYDVGQFGDRYFSYVASFGAFTRASYATPQNVKNALGHVAYLLNGAQELSQIRKEHVRIELEDRIIEDDFIFGAVSNSTSMGGVLTLDPRQVDMQDGKLELILVRAPKDLIELHEFVMALQNQTYNCTAMTFVSTANMKISADPQMPWTLDGEKADGSEQIEIRNLHHAIRLVKRG